jgi:hypothetical protein
MSAFQCHIKVEAAPTLLIVSYRKEAVSQALYKTSQSSLGK